MSIIVPSASSFQDDQLYSPTFKKPEPYASQLSTKDAFTGSDTRYDRLWESALSSAIREKSNQLHYEDQSMTVRQASSGVPVDMQLYCNVSPNTPQKFQFNEIPAPAPYSSEASRLVKQIYNKHGDKAVQARYQRAKRLQLERRAFETPKRSASEKRNSLIMNPRDVYRPIDVRFSQIQHFSKSQRDYTKKYFESLKDKCNELGYTKPLETRLCVDNYMYSQICPSGLATHKFQSVKAKKRLTIMTTQTMDSKLYPFSPKTMSQLEDINRKVNSSRMRIDRIKSNKDPNRDEYRDVFVKDINTITKNFLRQYQQFKEKKSKIFGSKLEEIEDVVEYMRNEKSDTDTAYDIVSNIHDIKRKPQSRQTKHPKSRNSRQSLPSSLQA